ncbi:nucleolar protein 11-like isoform X1 [Periplaneta americana]|uniref:nucleolar protein 11-like isoform X1 n=1 Tax=Periplaneta americana TaxID=6978 RepID=UPI0037E7DA33
MARLCAYYSLCPLIDQKSLLGVAEDSTSDCVIVTLGRNIVIRYKLLNQKQISSWSSKEKLSSPVIYDELGNQYIAVFNRNQLRIWSESEDNLDKIKKFKFQQHIHCVLSQLSGREPLIIFSNGATCLLSAALESRKIEIDRNSVLSANEVIEDCQLVTYETSTYITFFTRNSLKSAYFHVVPVSRDVSSVKVKVERENFQLMGQTTIQQDSSYNLLTLWSDGKLFSLTFLPEVDSKLPGTLVNIVRAVSTKHPVAMTDLSASHVAIYGADPSEEGASLIIYNVQFGVVQSRHHLKLFASPPRLWCTGTNLLITTAHNLVVVPYQLETQRLSSLIGAHCSNVSQSEKDYDLQEMCQMDVNWITNGSAEQAQSETEQMPDTLKQQLQTLQDNGYPQSMMVQKLLPDLLETKSVTELHWCIKYFTDIPENSLVQMLQFCLDNGVDNSERGPYSELLIAILHTTFNDVCLLPYLRAIPFSQAMTLLQYLCDEFDTDGSNVELSNVIDWTSLLLDAHYQRFVLSGDPQVQTLLCKLRELVHSQMTHVSELKKLQPLLQQFKQGELPIRKPQFVNKLYSIELLRLY